MKFIVSAIAVSLLVGPAAAEVKVDHEEGTDFSAYRTYAWRPGTEAPRPEVQGWIVAAVERELKAKGLRQVRDRPADVYVVTLAFAETDAAVRGNYVHLDRYDVGVITSDLVVSTKGVLMVDLIDGETDRPVWRGMASDVLTQPSPQKVRKKIDRLTGKLFRRFPPG